MMKSSRALFLAGLASATLIASPKPPQAQTSQQLQISMASWGYAGERKNVKDEVARLCDGKPTCKFVADNDTFAATAPKDPSPGNRKGLLLRWTCRGKEGRDQIPEGKNADLTCP